MIPSLQIEIPLEAGPRLRLVCMTEAEEERLLDWLRSRQELAELVDRAVELATEARAA